MNSNTHSGQDYLAPDAVGRAGLHQRPESPPDLFRRAVPAFTPCRHGEARGPRPVPTGAVPTTLSAAATPRLLAHATAVGPRFFPLGAAHFFSRSGVNEAGGTTRRGPRHDPVAARIEPCRGISGFPFINAGISIAHAKVNTFRKTDIRGR